MSEVEGFANCAESKESKDESMPEEKKKKKVSNECRGKKQEGTRTYLDLMQGNPWPPILHILTKYEYGTS